jgi:hypothetical protein
VIVKSLHFPANTLGLCPNQKRFGIDRDKHAPASGVAKEAYVLADAPNATKGFREPIVESANAGRWRSAVLRLT